jgi:predicted nucleic acid-binding protein
MKVYLDTCSIQRPLDSKSQIRITLEAEAILGIIQLCEMGRLEIVSSEVLEYEMSRNPLSIRRNYGFEVLAKADTFIALEEGVENRATAFTQCGIQVVDALHLASAESSQADFFCTCDDKFLKNAKKINDLNIKVVSPVELIEVIESW